MRAIIACICSLLSCGGCFGLSTGAEEYIKSFVANDFGYTLLGVKPISMSYGDNYFNRGMSDECKEEAKEFLVKTISSSQRFVLRRFSRYWALIDLDALFGLMSTSKTFSKFVTVNFGSFREFLYGLLMEKGGVDEFFRGDTVILAIVLGYGEKNGRSYLECKRLRELRRHCPFVSRDVGRKDTLVWQEPEEQAFAKPPFFIHLPRYASFFGPEAVRIHAGFVSARHELAMLFLEHPPSEVVSLLSEE